MSAEVRGDREPSRGQRHERSPIRISEHWEVIPGDRQAIMERAGQTAWRNDAKVLTIPASPQPPHGPLRSPLPQTQAPPRRRLPTSAGRVEATGTLLIVDDADHLDSDQLRWFTRNAGATNTKLVLVTDDCAAAGPAAPGPQPRPNRCPGLTSSAHLQPARIADSALASGQHLPQRTHHDARRRRPPQKRAAVIRCPPRHPGHHLQEPARTHRARRRPAGAHPRHRTEPVRRKEGNHDDRR